MMRLIPVCVLLVASLLAIPVLGAAAVAPGEVLATLEGEFVSLTAGPGGLFLLSAANQLVRIKEKGQTETIPLPALDPGVPQGRFSDLALQGSLVWLCRAQESRVYAFDPAKPQAWTFLAPTGDHADQALFSKIAPAGTFLGLQDLEGTVFTVDPAGKAIRRPAGELLFPSVDQTGLRLDREATAEGLLSWQVRDAAGRVLWERKGQDPVSNVVSLTVLGYDPQGRLIVLEATGNRDGGQTWQVLAIRGGKAETVRPIAGPGALIAVRMATLLADGSVAYLHLDEAAKKVYLYKVTM